MNPGMGFRERGMAESTTGEERRRDRYTKAASVTELLSGHSGRRREHTHTCVGDRASGVSPESLCGHKTLSSIPQC